jgi:predicted ATP-dependent endonuclease of OLD family
VAKIKSFTIKRFKGIESLSIDIANKSNSPVITLIGLNESGKTTVLEALSLFVTGDKSVASIFDGQFAASSAIRLIPMHLKAAFSDAVEIQADIEVHEQDIQELIDLAKKNSLVLDEKSIKRNFTLVKKFYFEDSALKRTINEWAISFTVKKPRGKQNIKLDRPDQKVNDIDFWLIAINHLSTKIERVSYFPTFLVDMPARIYLEEYEGETAINRHYRFAFQDILDSSQAGIDIGKHVCDRIREFKAKQNNQNWLSMLFGSPSKGLIDSVFQKISSTITREVLGSWQRIFQRSISANSITVDWGIDSQKNDVPYATFQVSDGESRFSINERSLGFRWFFSFLLFTAFKNTSDRKTIFIFDEPAANLHAKAQAELLKSFSRIASNGNRIIYSTHSHHMINPQWLGSAYIVENSALDYDKPDNFGLDTKPTTISAIPYRRFVSDFPSRSSYFQPVIERLEYVPPELIGAGPYLIVEGISDYYALELARKVLKKQINFSIMPGVGSGASDPVISQLMGQAQKFFILLDDDKEGIKAANRYKDEWYLTGERVATIASVDASFSNMALEKLLTNIDLEIIKNELGIASKPTKKQIGWYLAEACGTPSPDTKKLSPETLSKLELILDYMQTTFDAQPPFY